jgi:predicted dehydrogenase
MISAFHLRGWQRIPEVEIVALADPARAAAAERQSAFAPSAQIYPSIEAMLAAERLDFVDIISPPWLHADHCRRAHAAGLHVICQKPLCPELDEARALVRDLGASARLFAVHENHRHRPWFAEVRRRHAAGFFGNVRFLRIEQLDPYEPAETFKANAPRGVVLEYGTHLIDMLRALMGEPAAVHARFHAPSPRVRAESLAHLVFDCGDATATIDVAWKAGGVQQGSFLLVGDRGEAFYEGRLTRGDHARFRLVQGNQVVLDETRCPTDDYAESFYALEREVTDAMLAGRRSESSADDNLNTLAATFACYESAAEAKPIALR